MKLAACSPTTPAKRDIVENKPYGEWFRAQRATLDQSTPVSVSSNGAGLAGPELQRRQRALGFTREDLTHVLEPMALQAIDPVFSMGNDAPLAVMSRSIRPSSATSSSVSRKSPTHRSIRCVKSWSCR